MSRHDLLVHTKKRCMEAQK